MTRSLVSYSPIRHYRGDVGGFDFILDHIHGELRRLYWKSGGKSELITIIKEPKPTVEYLLTLPGRKRAEFLRASPELRKEYLRVVNGLPKIRRRWPKGMSKALAAAKGLD